jgi:hypothetical protein
MNNELSKRAVACKGWRWMSGMVCGHRHRVDLEPGNDDPDMGGCLPDLDDPATLGCLLALVREASGDPRCSTDANQSGDWTVYGCLPIVVPHRNTEAEALVEALESLEAAP